MITIFSKTSQHIPKWFIIDATNKTLGRLATQISNLLTGKNNSYSTPGSNQGNYVVVVNANKIQITGKKDLQKFYYSNSQRPGSLKSTNFETLSTTIPNRIIEHAVWGMLPKTIRGRALLTRLYIYKTTNINVFEQKTYTNLKLLLL